MKVLGDFLGPPHRSQSMYFNCYLPVYKFVEGLCGVSFTGIHYVLVLDLLICVDLLPNRFPLPTPGHFSIFH